MLSRQLLKSRLWVLVHVSFLDILKTSRVSQIQEDTFNQEEDEKKIIKDDCIEEVDSNQEVD